MTGLVEDLLQASHVMQGRIELDRQPVDLRKVVAEAVDSIAQAAQERRQALTVRTAEEPIPVSVDVLRIRQILANLLTNAVKYTPAEGSIEVRVEAADRDARVHVRDTGEGIAPEAHERVFSLFARASGAGGGLGIGLAVSQRLAAVHDGAITLQSDGRGRGSTFTLTLPLLAG